MSLSPVVARRAVRAGVLLALGAFPASLAAQHVVGADVNAAAETANQRNPLFFTSAALAPAGRLGFSLQAVGSRVVATYSSVENPDGTRLRSDVLTTMGSVAWGATSWLSLGAYLTRAEERFDPEPTFAPLPPDGGPDLPPTRQGIRTALGGNELGLHARVGVWRSGNGATGVTAIGRLRDRTDAAIAGAAGVALQHRVGRATLHLAPAAWFADNSSTALEMNGGAAFALGARLGLTGEVLHFRNTGSPTQSVTELATGLRYRIGRLALDAGVRHLAWVQPTRAGDNSRNSALVATHWSF